MIPAACTPLTQPPLAITGKGTFDGEGGTFHVFGAIGPWVKGGGDKRARTGKGVRGYAGTQLFTLPGGSFLSLTATNPRPRCNRGMLGGGVRVISSFEYLPRSTFPQRPSASAK